MRKFKELWKEFAEDGVANCAVMHRSDCVEETDDMIVVGSKNNDYYRITLFGKLDNSNNLKSIEKHFLGETYHDACEITQ
ncbi:hypothetical protein MSG28_007395 [Choristoneura fumiferana]|uniref:Uncharacterized protein n=1 Tax=Choristoneura fumiferana TaxID=7141 RepID=A0ACC0JX19_CHOFU|nr:hypothetical protein MSG28_007395 [Choristoneura fumiferana]